MPRSSSHNERDPEITDRMLGHATPFFPEWFVGRTVVSIHEVKDSEIEEIVLLLDDGRSCCISCDPVTHAEDGTRLPPEKWGERWEVVLYDTTDTEAGKALR